MISIVFGKCAVTGGCFVSEVKLIVLYEYPKEY